MTGMSEDSGMATNHHCDAGVRYVFVGLQHIQSGHAELSDTSTVADQHTACKGKLNPFHYMFQLGSSQATAGNETLYAAAHGVASSVMRTMTATDSR